MLVTINGPSKSQFQNDTAEVSYEILEILSRQENGDIGETLFSLSENPETCPMMRQSGKQFSIYDYYKNIVIIYFVQVVYR